MAKRRAKTDEKTIEQPELLDDSAETVEDTFEARVAVDETPERYRVMLPIVSSESGESVVPGQIVTRGGFLAHCDDNGISLLLQRGAIQPLEEA